MRRSLIAVFLLALVGCAAEANPASPPPTVDFVAARIQALRVPMDAPCAEQPPYAPSDQFELRGDDRAPSAKIKVMIVKQRIDGTGTDVFIEPHQPIKNQRITFLEVPSKDGDTLSAHVELELESGDTVDTTFGGAVVSAFGSCPTNG